MSPKSKLRHLFHAKNRWMIYVFALVGMVLFTTQGLQNSHHKYFEQLTIQNREKAQQFNDLFSNMENMVKLGRELFLNDLQKPDHLKDFTWIKQFQTNDAGFHLDHPQAPFSIKNSGNLTGYDSRLLKSVSGQREILSALSLNPFFDFAAHHVTNLSWIYYTSTSGFMNMYPHVPSKNFQLTRAQEELDFFKVARLESNPKRELIWTDPYEDGAGMGLMITASVPVDVQGKWVGLISMDITLGHIKEILSAQNKNSHLALVNQKGIVLAGLNWTDSPSSSNEFNLFEFWKNGVWISSVKIGQTDFQLRQAVYFNEWLRALARQNYFTFWIGLAVMILLLLIEVSARFQKRLLEAHLQLEHAKAEADRANEAKGQFLTTMSHEIRTPMNAIINIIEHLQEENQDQSKEEPLGVAGQAANHLLHLVNDVLDLSKIEAGKLHLEHRIFDLPLLLQTTAKMFAAEIERKKLQLPLELASNLPHYVLGDLTRVRQILVNLIGNAIKFTHQGKIELRAEMHDSQIQIQISDQGIGMTPQQQDRLFKPFAQAELNTSLHYGGTGLGLVICKKLVEQMGGEILLHSQIGKGTTFTMHIPFEISADAPQSLARSEWTQNSKHRILVVEDNGPNQMVIGLLLKKLGWNYEIANNGAEALNLLKSRADDFQIILMDMQMPVMDGISATQKIRQELGLKTPILAMTANAFKAELDQCLEVGMNDYITKPIHREELHQKLELFKTP